MMTWLDSAKTSRRTSDANSLSLVMLWIILPLPGPASLRSEVRLPLSPPASLSVSDVTPATSPCIRCPGAANVMSPASRAQCSGTPPNADGTKLDGATDCLSTGVAWKGARKKKGSPIEAPENAKVASSAVRGLVGLSPRPPPRPARAPPAHKGGRREPKVTAKSKCGAQGEAEKKSYSCSTAHPEPLLLLSSFFIYLLSASSNTSVIFPQVPCSSWRKFGDTAFVNPYKLWNTLPLDSINIFKSPQKTCL